MRFHFPGPVRFGRTLTAAGRHVKNLESRSQLLDTALASAAEANRRWEECRGIVESLRLENAQLRAENAGLRAENASLHSALAQSGFAHLSDEVGKNGELGGMDSALHGHDDRGSKVKDSKGE